MNILQLIDEPQLTNVQLACALPRNPRFREWVAYFCEVPAACPVSEDIAAQFIRSECAVTSRREIATNPEAAQRFHNLIRKPFVAYCEELKEPI